MPMPVSVGHYSIGGGDGGMNQVSQVCLKAAAAAMDQDGVETRIRTSYPCTNYHALLRFEPLVVVTR